MLCYKANFKVLHKDYFIALLGYNKKEYELIMNDKVQNNCIKSLLNFNISGSRCPFSIQINKTFVKKIEKK